MDLESLAGPGAAGGAIILGVLDEIPVELRGGWAMLVMG